MGVHIYKSKQNDIEKIKVYIKLLDKYIVNNSCKKDRGSIGVNWELPCL